MKYSRGYIYTEIRKKNIEKLNELLRTKEWKDRISKAHIGLKPSKKTREKMRISRRKRIDISGNKSHFWKGGISKINYKKELLERIKFRKTIQKQVFERDHYLCQICGSNKDLQVDHIQSWSEYVELRFNINNCRTLCSNCHYLITFKKPKPTHIKTWGHNLRFIEKKFGGDYY